MERVKQFFSANDIDNDHKVPILLSLFGGKTYSLLTHCIFGGNLNEVLRDRLAYGLLIIQIQKRLLSEANLRYSKAVEIAVAMEIAVRDNSELQSELRPVPNVDKLTESNKTTRAKPVASHFVTAVVETHTCHTIVSTRTRIVTTVENKATFSEFVFVCSKQHGKPEEANQTLRYMLLRLLLMLILMKTS